VPGRPGFPERLGGVEAAVKGLCEEFCEVREQVAEIVHELHPNAGGSLRDAVNRIEARTINLPRPALRRDGDDRCDAQNGMCHVLKSAMDTLRPQQPSRCWV